MGRTIFFIIVLLLTFTAMGSFAEGKYECENHLIEVMFSVEYAVRLRDGELTDLSGGEALIGLADVLESTSWYRWRRLVDIPEDRLDHMAQGLSSETEVYNLNNCYILSFQGEIDIWTLAERLQELPGIVRAMPVPLPRELPQPPDYQSYQGYLNAPSGAPTGINAIYAWSQPGGNGATVTVCDLEYSWNYSHGDITKAPGSQINTYVVDPFGDNNHGTAVLGEMVSDYNGWGTTGICYGAGLKTCGTYYGNPSPQWNVAGAIALATANLNPGDIILIEQQWEYVSGSGNYVPIEWWGDTSPGPQQYNTVYAAIQNAVANGIHVIEAGGNAVNGGGVDMDQMSWFGDSGAMIIGAGGVYPGGTYPGGDLQRLYFSNYGSRFNCQGWGEDVVTTGYGTLFSSQGVNYYYASSFSGTSSAAPIAAGAAACCVGYWKANGNPVSTLTPQLLRNVITNTGTPQVFPPSGNIGPRPNLTGAFSTLYSMSVESRTPVSADPMLIADPNPAGGIVRIRPITDSTAAPPALLICDLSGRAVNMIDPVQYSGAWTYLWNCRNSYENPVPSGVYLAVLELSGERCSVLITVLDP